MFSQSDGNLNFISSQVTALIVYMSNGIFIFLWNLIILLEYVLVLNIVNRYSQILRVLFQYVSNMYIFLFQKSFFELQVVGFSPTLLVIFRDSYYLLIFLAIISICHILLNLFYLSSFWFIKFPPFHFLFLLRRCSLCLFSLMLLLV